ncbi:RCC1 and BTB domain-containing protein 2 [Seminavis robusta]|uniref:RCC1 and BTB domain-containing protein 2 n=1 Tax=Seminavis robusta TaxID=568900 RepID=A0A9N8DNU6_9STRA|nr:RCC1 and BTB domain-containing protein 2 [Seminavis robusta]|eukprot:Sro182_g079420.1 RCC1 and BTB domain-containing protein 2 (890) ;mRNA; r:65031-67700
MYKDRTIQPVMDKSKKLHSNGATLVAKRRAVTSLSPAKERHAIDRLPLPNSMDQLRPGLPIIVQTKSSNLLSGSRPPTKPPPLPRRSIAVSQEETCLVSAAGDVMVCRGREFVELTTTQSSTQYGTLVTCGSNVTKAGSVGWCDLECSKLPLNLEKSALCNPWLTRLGGQREEKKEDDRTTMEYSGGLRGGSTYEWEAHTADHLANADFPQGRLEIVVAESSSAILSPQSSPVPLHDLEGDDEDRVLSMPSFDYSHFGAGGNDMLPSSPHRFQSRRRSDPAEVDVNLVSKGAHTEQVPIQRTTQQVASFFQPESAPTTVPSAPSIFHGVPTFLSSLSQVRIQHVSAHPRGSHVLMISTEALLFSYGLNDHGQLGIGIKSPGPGEGAGSHSRYVWTPTIITPLLENGGKAVICAAGESHSLVVVSTEGRRVLKAHSPQSDTSSQPGTPATIKMNRVSSSPPSMNTERENYENKGGRPMSPTPSAAASVWHHQLYGFGRNNSMKIGLVHPRRKRSIEEPVSPQSPDASNDTSLLVDYNPDDMEDVLLPHRVALLCTVWPESTANNTGSVNGSRTAPSSSLPQGIFALTASSEHSAALVRRATGSVELYTWGNAAYHALGLSKKQLSALKIPKTVPVPTLVESLSLQGKDHQSPKPSNSLLKQDPPEYPVDIALGPYSSFVVTSKGRCLSFGISYDGMLGLGNNVVEAREPKDIKFRRATTPVEITSLSAGASHVMALARDGTVFSWGKNTDGRLGLGEVRTMLPPGDQEEAPELERTIEWAPTTVPRLTRGCADLDNSNRGDDAYGPVVQVCAGLDCSILVTECGQVFSCGKHSGRLGLGEADSDVYSPTPLFGGLSLWRRPNAAPRTRQDKSSPPPLKSRPFLKRGMTTG